MKKHLINHPTRVSDLSFEEFYDDISADWRGKAARLRARRERAMHNS